MTAAPYAASVPTDDIAIARRVLQLEGEALAQLSAALGPEFTEAVDLVIRAKARTILTGVGKSGHVARKIAATLASTGTSALFVHPTEASHGDLGMITADDVVIALSKSGETAELSDVIAYTRRFGIPLIGMTAGAESALARSSDVRLLIPNAPEACGETNAPTTSTTLMMALGDALAVALLERRGFRAENFKLLHPGGKLGAMLLVAADLMHAADELPLIEAGADLRRGVERISEKGFGAVGVVDAAGGLAGIITDGDLRRHLARGGDATLVDDVMTRRPMTATPDALAAQLIKTMNERKIMQVFVVDGANRPVGLVHMHDLLRAGVA